MFFYKKKSRQIASCDCKVSKYCMKYCLIDVFYLAALFHGLLSSRQPNREGAPSRARPGKQTLHAEKKGDTTRIIFRLTRLAKVIS